MSYKFNVSSLTFDIYILNFLYCIYGKFNVYIYLIDVVQNRLICAISRPTTPRRMDVSIPGCCAESHDESVGHVEHMGERVLPGAGDVDDGQQYEVVDAEGLPTEKVHAYNKKWGQWLTCGEKVY